MRKRSKIVRMDDWDVESVEHTKRQNCLRCDFTDTLRLHVKHDFLYFSLFKRSHQGVDFDTIKQSSEHGALMAGSACSLIDRLVLNLEGWCIVTTPRRRHFEGFNLSEFVSGIISEKKNIPFYKGAVQCITKDRLNPEFHLLREIPERKVIIFDDIITTGMTLKATRDLLLDKDQVLCIVGIHNN